VSQYDVVVVGAGTAGIPCAIEAARTKRVLVLEGSSTIGGTLAVSAGHMSAAGARRQREAGIEDTPDLHFADVMAIGGGLADPALVRLAVEEAPRTVDWLDDHGFDFDPVTPTIYRGHTPYSRPRTFWGLRRGGSILETMRPLWDAAVADGRIELRLEARVAGIEQTAGRASGVRLATGAGDLEVSADAIVLASGGYGSNAGLFAALTPGSPRLVTNAVPSSTGDALHLAESVGGAIRFADRHTPRLGLIEQPPGSGRVDFWSAMLQLTAAERPPHEIWVNRRGERFVAEDREDVTSQEHAVMAQPGSEMWVLFDERGRTESRTPLVRQWDEEALERQIERGELVHRADTVPELAAAVGIDAEALARSVAAFNEAVASRDDPFGRQVLLGPLDRPPFYAIHSPCAVLRTFGGVDVDVSLQVRRPDGSTIGGVFAVGEAIGMGATSGRAFCGGMAVTPALGFGRRVGQALAEA
jgi:fumarate reductase flavoprotein subunit